MKHATARRLLLLCTAAAALLTSLVGPALAAEPTLLTASAQAEGAGIAIAGTLTSNGEPVADATIEIAVDSTPATSTTTDGAGSFKTTASADATAAHTLQVSFTGDGDLSPNTIEVTFTPAPVQTKAATTLSVSVADASLYPGELLVISGALEAAGSPVANGEINVFIKGQEQGESLAYTDEDGRFSTYAEVPADLPAGETALRVVHPGNRRNLPSEKTISLAIQQADPEPTGEPATPSAEPTPADPTTTAAAGTTTEAASSAVPMATGDAATEEAEPAEVAARTSPVSWFWVGAVVAGGCAVLVAIALLMRRAATQEERRERAEGVEPLYLLADDEDDSYLPEAHGWVTEEFLLDEDFPDEDPRETTPTFPAPSVSDGPVAERQPDIYRDAEEPVEHPKPRRSWSGEA